MAAASACSVRRKTWSFTNVDTQFYGYNGAMYEVAPNIVLFLYGGELDVVACACTPALRQVVFRVDQSEWHLVAMQTVSAVGLVTYSNI